jgi:exodeoxyribonuclease III
VSKRVKEEFEYIIFAIWANNKEDKDGQYVEQVWKAINHYEKLLNIERVVFIGDFNSNTIWDRPKRKGNHSDVVQKLASHKIESLYHRKFGQVQGKEQHPTFLLQKNRTKPYHIDYCLASEYLIERTKSFEIGQFEEWIDHSDHVPLEVEFENH